MQTLDGSAFLTVHETASLLRVSQPTIRRLIRRGDLPSIRVGQQLRIRPIDIDRALRTKVSVRD